MSAIARIHPKGAEGQGAKYLSAPRVDSFHETQGTTTESGVIPCTPPSLSPAFLNSRKRNNARSEACEWLRKAMFLEGLSCSDWAAIVDTTRQRAHEMVNGGRPFEVGFVLLAPPRFRLFIAKALALTLPIEWLSELISTLQKEMER